MSDQPQNVQMDTPIHDQLAADNGIPPALTSKPSGKIATSSMYGDPAFTAAVSHAVSVLPPSQVAHPWRATLRTVAAMTLSAIVMLSVALPLIADALKAYLPENVMSSIVIATGVCTALVGLITRLMAVPAVNAFLANVGLGAEPK